jgi:hypothetical protein
MSFTIHGIQHLGVGVPNHEASWKWYRKFFGMDIPFPRSFMIRNSYS